MGKYHEVNVNITSDTLLFSIEISIWDMLFVMSCSPKGWYEIEAQQRMGRAKSTMWWGKGMPIEIAAEGDLRTVEFKEGDRGFERRQRGLW